VVEVENEDPKLHFKGRLNLECRGARVITKVGLLGARELEET
jgi:hypothetical protein